MQIFPGVTSIYTWDSKLHTETECVLQAKTTRSRYPDFEALVRELHPYDVPECVAVAITECAPAYKNWAIAQVQPDKV